MEKTYNRINGEFLGYPECCIKAFGDMAIPLFQRPQGVRAAVVNGFVPCEHHANELNAGRITPEELINPNRQCSIPFDSCMSPVTR